jgi:hypothetical protein
MQCFCIPFKVSRSQEKWPKPSVIVTLHPILLKHPETDDENVVLLQLTVLAIFGPGGLKGMAKHCIFEHFLRFVKQIRPKPSVVVTL